MGGLLLLSNDSSLLPLGLLVLFYFTTVALLVVGKEGDIRCFNRFFL